MDRARLADDRLRLRLIALKEHLATTRGPFAVIVGDSHAEFLPWGRLCGRPVLNLGFGGMGAGQIADALRHLDPPRQADMAVLFAGTNDLHLAADPASVASKDAFRARFGALVTDLRRFAPRLAYVPLMPPAGDARAQKELALSERDEYRGIATAICRQTSCVPVDVTPFERSFAGDGVHLDREARGEGGPLQRAIEAAVCPGGTNPPS